MPIPYVLMKGRLGISAGDTVNDPDDEPDLIPCTSGIVRFTPLSKFSRLLATSGVAMAPLLMGNSSIACTLNTQGQLVYQGSTLFKLIDFTSTYINPHYMDPNEASWKVTFEDVRAADGSKVDFQPFNIAPLSGGVENELSTLAPTYSFSTSGVLVAPNDKGLPNGTAPLDSNAKIPLVYFPDDIPTSGSGPADWDTMVDKPATFPPSAHGHPATDIADAGGKVLMTDTERTKLGGVAAGATVNSTDAQLRDRSTHTGTQSADSVVDGTTNKAYTATEKTKLAGVAAGATVNATDAQLRDRSTHTGTQSADSIIDGTTNKAYTAVEKTKLAGVATGATANASDTSLRDRSTHTGTQTSASISDFVEAAQDAIGALLASGTQVSLTYNDAANSLVINATGADAETMRDTIGAALVGVGAIVVTVNDAGDTISISTSATVNSTDAQLRDRSTHTGTQAISTVSGLQAALDSTGPVRDWIYNYGTGSWPAQPASAPPGLKILIAIGPADPPAGVVPSWAGVGDGKVRILLASELGA
jgi:hypothetical protein